MRAHSGIAEFVPSSAKGAVTLNQDLFAACRAVDRDIENLGALTAVTIDMVRAALKRITA